MKARDFMLIASALVVFGCDKEPSATSVTTDAGHTGATAVAIASATAPSSASGATPSTPAPAAPASSAIPSQADESIAAAKEIDKTNYKNELTAIENQLK